MEGADFGDELDDELDVAPAEATVAAATAVTAEAAAAAAAAMEATAAAEAADDDDAAEATSPSLSAPPGAAGADADTGADADAAAAARRRDIAASADDRRTLALDAVPLSAYARERRERRAEELAAWLAEEGQGRAESPESAGPPVEAPEAVAEPEA